MRVGTGGAKFLEARSSFILEADRAVGGAAPLPNQRLSVGQKFLRGFVLTVFVVH